MGMKDYFLDDGFHKEPITSVVFLVASPISNLEADQWGFKYLESQDFGVYILDLSYLLNNKTQAKKNLDSSKWCNKNINIHVIESYDVLDTWVSRLSVHSIFVDYLVGISAITIREERVFRVLKNYKAKYIVISAGPLPVPTSIIVNRGSAIERNIILLKKMIIHRNRLLKHFFSRAIKYLVKKRYFYPSPAAVFGVLSPLLKNFILERDLGQNEIIPINSYDYEAYIKFIDRQNADEITLCGCCVFLDEALTHHSDFDILGIPAADPKIYYSRMNQFFSYIEIQTGLKVVIAAHPRSKYDENENPFEGREIIRGKTVDLVSQSKLVLMHLSTSMSYAVLFEKPIIAVEIPGMSSRSNLNKMVEVMSLSIDCQMVKIEKMLPSKFFSIKPINKEKYEDYKVKYLSSRTFDNLSTWQIIVSWIKS
jgi:hypothetical protein